MGLVPPWAKDPAIGSQLINARSETVAEKPSFRHAVKYRRCIVPASGFFDWKHEGKVKTPYYFRMKDGTPLGLAGLWEEWKAPDGTLLDTFTILTTTANKVVAPIHDRMPVILPPDEYLTDTAMELITEQIADNRESQEIPDDVDYAGFIFDSPASGRIGEDGAPRPRQAIANSSIAMVIRRNISAPVLDDKGKPLFTADGKPTVKNLLGVADFTPHDLRRTAATFMSQLGELDEIIDAVLNHTKQGIIRTYNLNRYDREKQTALESWERKLQAIIAGAGKGNVVSINTAKKAA